MAETLFLRLGGPLQSWGERGRWSVRDTAAEPTKSGVVGLIACALGLKQDEDLRTLSQQLRMGVRCDAPGTHLTDYHTIGGGYDTPMLLTAEGKAKKRSGRPHTEISLRDYLCNASFLVALQATEPGLLTRIAAQIQNPVWPIYLGRKSCPPARPLLEGLGEYDSLAQALAAWPWYRPEAGERTVVRSRVVLPSSAVEGGIGRRHEIISRKYRTYGPRYTHAEQVEVQVVPTFPPVWTAKEET